jgi:tetratricopeptide (TPR) repeat protein
MNVKLTNDAWLALNKGDYKSAIDKANKCVDEFGPLAEEQEHALDASNTQIPPNGTVNEIVKKDILNRGLLNDVATCWFIKGRSLEKLGKNSESIQAYKKCEEYTYARTYDPDANQFWSPSEASRARRVALEKRQTN